MVQEFSPRRSHGSYLVQTLAPSLGEGLGKFLASYQANKAFNALEKGPEWASKSPQEKLISISNTARQYGPIGEQILKTKFEMEKLHQNKTSGMQLMDILTQRGVSSDVAKHIGDLYGTATEGGKTEIIKNFLDLEKRGLLPNQSTQEEGKEADNSALETDGFQWPKIQPERGATPSDMIKREDKREAVNIPFYNENRQELRSSQNQGRLINRLIQLNDSEKLPKGFGRVTIDPKSGEIFFPGTTNAETQLYEKTINEFTTLAKDSYGARVTNFDLQQFMRRLPRLSNSSEGRKLILQQMKIVNDLNDLEKQSLIDVYDKYGVGRINTQQAQKIATDYRKGKEEALISRLNDLDGMLNKIENPKSASPDVPEGRIKVEFNGKVGHISADQLEEALKQGYKRV